MTEKGLLLSPAEYEALGKCVEKWGQLLTHTGPADQIVVKEALTTVYATRDLPCPQIVWCASPISLILTMHAIATSARALEPKVFQALFASWFPTDQRDALHKVAAKGFNDTYALDLPPVSVNHFLPSDVFRARTMGAVQLENLSPEMDAFLDVAIKLPSVPLDTMMMRFLLAGATRFVGTAIVRSEASDNDLTSVAPLWQALHTPLGLADRICKWDFLESVMGFLEISPIATAERKLAQSCFACSVSTNIAWISDWPVEVHVRDGRLHHDGGVALAWADEIKLWMLNGVPVGQEIAETPAEQIDPQLVLQEGNVDMRREIVRKIGVERLIQKLSAVSIDKHNGYELLDVGAAFPDKRYRPYLKMLNPSTGTWHVEGVGPNCRTVADALGWRNQTQAVPEVIA